MFLLRTLLAALAGNTLAVAAETTTVSLLLRFDHGEGPLVGSVIKADPDKTTYAIGCAPDTSATDCPVDASSHTLMQGPLTAVYTTRTVMSDYGGYSNPSDPEGPHTGIATLSDETTCKFNLEKNTARCNEAQTIVMSSLIKLVAFDDTITSLKQAMTPVIITGGAEKLSSAPGATKSNEQPTATASASGSLSTTALMSSTSSLFTTSSTKNAAGPGATHKAGSAAVIVIGAAAILL
ncbi:hypothetical protein QQS21_000788 [Conoideocrella luteorostrata]|uniref:Uncharacterized protein n=1 Tax=Conoideocrella luteorostrata TaxID=1105319 RepID=A0AAJ0FY86_9HYPO|nr:hypothetical protein QQS21_000788 [Conoideocrella luteorostrata]